MRRLFTALAASLPLIASAGQAQLLPFGEFAARDGRPGPGKTWKVDDVRGRQLAAQLNAVAALTPVVIDYEHQTLLAAQNGKPAPAAGWIKSAAWRDGEGLFAEVEWTAAAKAEIEGGAYKYISPVISYDDAGNVNGVALAALTNFPALLGMDAVVAALSGHFNHTEPDMTLLATLVATLGLAATTTEAEAIAAVSALKSRPPVPTALTTALGLTGAVDEQAALSAVAALKKTDPDTIALITGLQGQVAALSTQLSEGGLVADVDGAIAAHKFAPAMREQLLNIGRKDRASLTAMLAAAPVIPGLGGQSGTDTTKRDDKVEALTATQKVIANRLGIPEADYLKQLQASA